MRAFYSIRTGSNADGFSFDRLKAVFLLVYEELKGDGYFDENLGSFCVDEGYIPGKVRNPTLDILLKLRKDNIWPIEERSSYYNEDDLFDTLEYLYTVVSKPIEGSYHSFSNCGMHWETFSRSEGQDYFVQRINELLSLYVEQFRMSQNGEILREAEKGFEAIFEADTPTGDQAIVSRIDSAILKFRRHGSSLDDRRQAVRDLCDVLEYLRPQVRSVLTNQDESDLFNIANNFGIRHHNDNQKTNYDQSLWLSWMFYFYLATIHVVLRKLNSNV